MPIVFSEVPCKHMARELMAMLYGSSRSQRQAFMQHVRLEDFVQLMTRQTCSLHKGNTYAGAVWKYSVLKSHVVDDLMIQNYYEAYQVGR